jgi:diguanylate cyclase (GGDEF)-like protein
LAKCELLVGYRTTEDLPISKEPNTTVDKLNVDKLFRDEQLRLSRSELPFAAKAISGFYFVVATSHYLLLEGIEQQVMVPAALLASFSAILVLLYHRRAATLSRSAVAKIQLLFCALTSSNALIHLWVSGDISQTINILILFVFIIYLRLPVWLFGLMLALVTLVWLAIVLNQQVEEDLLIHYGFGIAMTNAIASLIYANNHGLTYRGIVGFRERLLLQRELKQANAQLANLAMQDPLTGIANRRSLSDFYEKTSRRAAISGEYITIAVCDVDAFKAFNDAWGHVPGDDVLVRVAELLDDNIRQLKDRAGRVGGDEFALIMSDTNSDGAEKVAQRIFKNVPIEVDGGAEVTISMGLYSFVPQAGQSFAEVLDKADKALYQAKSQGKGHFHIAVD